MNKCTGASMALSEDYIVLWLSFYSLCCLFLHYFFQCTFLLLEDRDHEFWSFAHRSVVKNIITIKKYSLLSQVLEQHTCCDLHAACSEVSGAYTGALGSFSTGVTELGSESRSLYCSCFLLSLLVMGFRSRIHEIMFLLLVALKSIWNNGAVGLKVGTVVLLGKLWKSTDAWAPHQNNYSRTSAEGSQVSEKD